MARFRLPEMAVLKYYLYQATDSVGFIWPVFTLFLLWNDLTFTQIGTLGAISAALVVVFEVPTGYVADRLGRRNALVMGMFAMTLSISGFVVVDTFLGFAILYAVWSLALSLQSGTADAWLYETLKQHMDEASFTRVRGRGGAVYQWASAVTMVAGGFLYVLHPTYPFVASAILNGVGVIVVLTMPKNAQFEGSAVEETVGARESLSLLRSQFAKPALRVFVPFVALFFAIVNVADTYVQPITVDVLEEIPAGLPVLGVDIPEEATLGVVYAGFAVLAALASYHAETVRNLLGLRAALLFVPVAAAALFVTPLVVPLLAIPVFFVMKGANALYRPLVNQYLNDRTGSAGRATVLSAASMAYALVRAPLKPLAGFVADLTSPIALFGALGMSFVVVAIGLLLVRAPILDVEGSTSHPGDDSPSN